jgi:antitoxin ParD1/3/4
LVFIGIYWYLLVFIGIKEIGMAKNTSISLGPHFDEFISGQVNTGRYGSASEVVRAALRMLENAESKMETLRTLLVEGEKSGFTDYSHEVLVDDLDGRDQ